MQRDKTALTARKEKIKMCIDAMQQEVQLRFGMQLCMLPYLFVPKILDLCFPFL